jgi:hypothetical protein
LCRLRFQWWLSTRDVVHLCEARVPVLNQSLHSISTWATRVTTTNVGQQHISTYILLYVLYYINVKYLYKKVADSDMNNKCWKCVHKRNKLKKTSQIIYIYLVTILLLISCLSFNVNTAKCTRTFLLIKIRTWGKKKLRNSWSLSFKGQLANRNSWSPPMVYSIQ